MPAIASLVINDGTANRTFVPQSIEGNISTYTYQPSGTTSLDARWKITYSVSLPKIGSEVARVKVKMVIPVMDTVDTTKKVADTVLNAEYILPKRGLVADRTALWYLSSNGLALTMVRNGVEDFNNVY